MSNIPFLNLPHESNLLAPSPAYNEKTDIKLPVRFQNQLLNFMESGRVKVDQQNRQYDFEIKGAKVFASANELNWMCKSCPYRRPCIDIRRNAKEFGNKIEELLAGL